LRLEQVRQYYWKIENTLEKGKAGEHSIAAKDNLDLSTANLTLDRTFDKKYFDAVAKSDHTFDYRAI